MAFNRNTYYANKYRRTAFERIALAKQIKALAAEGKAFPSEVARIPHMVKMARSDMRLSLMYRSFKVN